MLFRRLHQSRTANTVLFWLIPVFLLSLGLRVCLHTPHVADADHAHAATIHLESNITSPLDSSDDDANDCHVSLAFVLFKLGQLDDGFAAVILPATVLLLLLFRQTVRVPAPAGTVPALSGGHRFRPPLRAPPR